MSRKPVDTLKDLLGEIPYTAEFFSLLRGNKPIRSRYTLANLQKHLPALLGEVSQRAEKAPRLKKVLLFASLHYWVEQTALLGMTLAAQGYEVYLAYLPYFDWQKPINRFDLRRLDIFTQSLLDQARPYIHPISLLKYQNSRVLSPELLKDIERVSYYDAQYTLQVETVDTDSDIYQMRLIRNRYCAEKLQAVLDEVRPAAMIVPNGTIQELGAAYRVARHNHIPVSTYEFSDQKDCIWMAQDAEIMRQETGGMWKVKREQPFTDEKREKVQELYRAKVQGDTWKNFVRHWQFSPRAGGSTAATELGLDDRPLVLLATNVLGDSLTLGRQVFSQNMADWIEQTLDYFAKRTDAQLVIRVHPGETLTHGPSMVDVVRARYPELPESIHLVGPKDKVNTYDLVEIASLGLVYTTTTGMEMAMHGVPVVVAGVTHYKGNGFTHDPKTYPEYFQTLDRILADPQAFRLNEEQSDLAWYYAYCFFFEFSLPFPWRLVNLWEDYKDRPIPYVLGEGMAKYEKTFRYLTGDPIEW